jgi:FAD synthase
MRISMDRLFGLTFWTYLRGDEKFNSLEDLKNQLTKDEKAARKILLRPE